MDWERDIKFSGSFPKLIAIILKDPYTAGLAGYPGLCPKHW